MTIREGDELGYCSEEHSVMPIDMEESSFSLEILRDLTLASNFDVTIRYKSL